MTTLALNPIAFSIGSFPVHWYGIILAFAAVAGYFIAMQEGKRFGIHPDFFMDLLLLGLPSAIICARIYYVAFKWEDYKDNLWDVFKIWEGGIAIYGAIIGAFICGFFYFRYKGYNFWRIVDICVPALLIGQMIGRWGNFMNQEAYGGPTTEEFLRNSLHLPDFIVNQMFIDGIYRHPTFLYESVWSFVGLIILFVLRRQKFVRAGEIMAAYFIWYSIGRFYIEALRTDSLAFTGPSWLVSLLDGLWSPMTGMFEQGYLDPVYGNVRISQLLALLLIIFMVILIIVRRVTGLADAKYLDPIVSTKPQKNMPITAEGKGSKNKGDADSGVAASPVIVDSKPSHKVKNDNNDKADSNDSDASDSGSGSSSGGDSGGGDGGGGGGD